jgi:enamine deaminase RidA (YjgF/YER057c/UK114 family)
LGELDRIDARLRVFGMVNAGTGFGSGTGGHARSAVGIAGLPFDIPMEIEAEVAIRGL